MPMPPAMTRTRAPDSPRMMGRPEPGTNAVEDTPGSLARVSPSVAPIRSCRSAPLRTETALDNSDSLRRSPVAVTTISSEWAMWSISSSTSVSSPAVTVTDWLVRPTEGISTIRR